MEYKYENVENVEAKQDFEVYFYNEHGDVDHTKTVRKGTKGIMESMGWSSTDNFRKSYDIRFKQDDDEIEVSFYEEKMEELLILV